MNKDRINEVDGTAYKITNVIDERDTRLFKLTNLTGYTEHGHIVVTQNPTGDDGQYAIVYTAYDENDRLISKHPDQSSAETSVIQTLNNKLNR